MREIHEDLCETHIIGRRSREWRVTSSECRAMAACGIVWAGWTDAAWRYEFCRLRPAFAGLIVCDQGLGQVWVDGNWQACGPGQAYLLPAGAAHAYRSDRIRRWKICWVAIKSERGAGDGTPDLGRAPQLVAADPRSLRGAIQGLQWELTGPAEPAAVQNWIELIRDYALRIARPQQPNEDRLWRLWENVDADLARPWCVGDLADLVFTSNEHLRRLCRARLGRSPMNHVTHLRMRRAAALLVSTNQKVETIARAVGYENPFAFTIAFKRHTGVPPKTYRIKGATGPHGDT